jgi:hypothetical protein
MLRHFGRRNNDGGTPWLELGQAALDKQFDPGDVAAVVRGEEQDGIRDFVHRAHPAHRLGGVGAVHQAPCDHATRRPSTALDVEVVFRRAPLE